jgi:hypothetical protein
VCALLLLLLLLLHQVPDLSGGEDPDDAFSRVPYEKGFYFLYYLQVNALRGQGSVVRGVGEWVGMGGRLRNSALKAWTHNHHTP